MTLDGAGSEGGTGVAFSEVDSMGAETMNIREPDPEISLVMPCYNEERCIDQTAPELTRAFSSAGVALELVLVDNGSTDGTGRVIDELVARGLPIRKVTVEQNRGYGDGILRGLDACRAPVVGYLCADGQVAAEDVLRTFRLIQGREDRVLAKVRRRFREDSVKRKVVSIIYNGLMQASFGWLGAIDINASPKILSQRNYRAMDLRSRDWFLDPEIILKAKAMGLRVIEIDVEGRPRRSGTSHVRKSTMLEFLKNIWRYRTHGELREWRRHRQERAVPPDREASTAPPADRAAAGSAVAPAPLLERIRVVEQRRFQDGRGYVHKILTASQCGGRPPGGEVYVTAARPGQVKGNHFHRFMGEWFAVVEGRGSLELEDPDTGERESLELEANHPRTVFVPPGIAHAVVNRGDLDLVCVAWAEREHDPEDVFPWAVVPSSPAEARSEVE